MPGLVGVAGISNPRSFSNAIEKIRHFSFYETEVHRIRQDLILGRVFIPTSRRSETSCQNDDLGLMVMVHGTVFKELPHRHVVSASDILHDYASSKWARWQEYEGSFMIVIIDAREDCIHVVNDCLGSLPLYFFKSEDVFAFGPEAKFTMTVAGVTPALSEHGLVNFLAAGYNVADYTLFEGVKFLQPGTLISYHVSDGTLSETRLWKITYEPNSDLKSRSDAEAALFSSICDSHRLLLSDNADRFLVSLSGGFDSKGMMGVLDKLGSLPIRATGWGMSKDIPDSDPYNAERLAREFNVPFDFFEYHTDSFVESAEEWTYVSELANDNFGWYGEGCAAIRDFYNVDADFAFYGDESWGWGGHVYNEAEMRNEVLPSTLPRDMQSIISIRALDRAKLLYDRSINKVMLACENTSPDERKDFLYLHGRVARFIFSLGYYRELSLACRRPFLTRRVLEVVRRLPSGFRVHKNLYITMLSRYLPRTTVVPNATVNSLPDWSYDMRHDQVLNQYFLKLLDTKNIEQGPLSLVIDIRAFEALRDGFFSEDVKPIVRSRNKYKELRDSVERMFTRTPTYNMLIRMKRTVKKKETEYRKIGKIDVLRRIALIVLLQEQLNDFSGSSQQSKAIDTYR
jgi:hypothetical protein